MNIVPTTPITRLLICHNVPLDATYTDTLTFSNSTAQYNYFAGKAKYTYNNFGPIRMENAIRVPRNADDLYDCNYIAFQNANFGTKWFYAFITKIEYVNTNMTLVYFDLDVMQTWAFDYTVHPCFVEREHVNDDTIGANIVEENIGTGPMVFENRQQAGISSASNAIIVICSAINEDSGDAQGGMYGNIYNGCAYFTFPATAEGAQQVSEILKDITELNRADSIVSIFMASDEFFAASGETVPTKNWNIIPNLTTIDGYTPKNKKLFTYPYHYLFCSNCQGNSAEYRVEFFETTSLCGFRLIGETSCTPTVTIVPLNYKYTPESGATDNFNEKMTLEGFPQCAWTIDSFRAWLAQNAGNTAISVLGSAFTAATALSGPGGIAAMAAGGAMSSGALAGTTAGLLGVASSLNQIGVQSSRAGQAYGSQGSGGMYAYYNLDFFMYEACVTSDYAKIIDDYFNMYGYAVKETKVPNMTGRASWNYVKTMNAKITGSIPFGDIEIIKNNFDKGITFWHGDYVGDYSRSNAIV